MTLPPKSPFSRWQRARIWLNPAYVWRRLLNNLGPKLLALAAAVVLWFISTGDQRANVQQSYDVPITVRDMTGGAERRAVSGLSPDTVRVTLTGRPERLRELRSSNVEAVLDVTGVPEGSFNRPVIILPPSDTTLSKTVPERVQGFMDTQLTRTLAVTLGVADPAENSLPRYVLTPEKVDISGSGRILGQVKRIVTSPAALAPGEETELPLLALSEAGNVVDDVEIRPSLVSVRRVDTGELPVKTLNVTLAPPPAGLRVTSAMLQPSSVRVIGAPELLARLRDVSGQVVYRPGSYSAQVRLKLPGGAQALDNVEATLQVERSK